MMRKLIILIVLTSCSPMLSKKEAYVREYQAGCFEEVESDVSTLLEKKGTNEQVWLLLDRATERLVKGDAEGAVEDYKIAIETIDYFNESGFLETLGQTLFYDGASPYRGDDYEQLLARIYFSLALLQMGDESNASALLRQAEELSQAKREEYLRNPATSQICGPENRFGRYLFATLLERKGDLSNAHILYQQSGIDLGKGGPATVLFVCHNGNAPFKYTDYSPGSQASALAFEMFMCTQNQGPALSTLTGIPVPALARRPGSFPLATSVKFGQTIKPLQPVFSIFEAAQRELCQKRPVVIARGAARLMMRRAAVYALEKQDPNLAALVDLGMLMVNLSTSADTRSWNLLPEQLELGRFDVEPGCHTFHIEMGSGSFPARLHLKKGDLAVIQIFNVAPGNSQILIPQHFQENHP